MSIDINQFECPRCGSGVRPADLQCHRCGEMLNRTQYLKGNKASDRYNLKTVSNQGYEASKFASNDLLENETKLEKLREQLDAKERLLKSKEKEIDDIYNQMEEDATSLEETIEELDQREQSLRQLQAELIPPEPTSIREMETLAAEDYVIQRLMPMIASRLNAQLHMGREPGGFEVIATHNPKLDSLLGGGIPIGHVILVSGAPGTMKSTFCYHILAKAAADGKQCLYMSLEQRASSLARQMNKMGMDVSDNIMLSDMVDLRREDSEGNWRRVIMDHITKVHETPGFSMLVLDSLEAFKAISGFEYTRQDVRALFDHLSGMGVTSLLISETSVDTRGIGEEDDIYLADGVIELRMRQTSPSAMQRWMRCLKMRGNRNDTRYQSFHYEKGELILSVPIAPSF